MDIKDIIEKEFGLIVNYIKVLGEGLDSVAYLVNNDYIFKMSKHQEARDNLKKEIQVLNYIKGKLSLQIPTIDYYSEKYSICGYKEIKGTILTSEYYEKMNSEEKEQLAKDISLFCKELHSLPLPKIKDLELNVIEDYESDYKELKENIYDSISEKAKIYLDGLFDRILNDERITKYDIALCHNDLSCNHIVMDNNKIIGIIDFGDVAITDRDKDFVYLLENSNEELGRNFGLKVLDYYNHPNKDVAILKADLNDEYYSIELILGGEAKEIKEMIDEGLEKLENLYLYKKHSKKTIF